MRIVIVTGMSGAGKTTALKFLEDFGFYCVDNLPIPLIPKFLELADSSSSALQRIALGVDIRSMETLPKFKNVLKDLREHRVRCEILFLEASDECLLKRYKETRRSHPLAPDGGLEDGIARERQALSFLRENAEFVLNTSQLLTRELKAQLADIFLRGEQYNNLFITVTSFGFKYGIPADADLVFDVRFLPNPYYFEDLRPLTGNDEKVSSYVMQFKQSHIFMEKLVDMLQFLIPNYVSEGKTQLVIAIGCTGGKHRSVTIANELYQRLGENKDYGLRIDHRDIEKDRVRNGK